MRKAFTLLELLIVVVIIVTLMTIVFRIGKIGSDSDRRNRTITRMQRLENCLSGYYAAFGSYPPVKLHGTRDIYQSVGSHGIQTDDRNENLWGWSKLDEQTEHDAWRQVQAACRSQPMGCCYPYPEGYGEFVVSLSSEMAETPSDYSSDTVRQNALSKGFDDGYTRDGGGRFSQNRDKSDWRNIQLFKFGIMSYLLPRYLVMMNGDAKFFTNPGYAQWTDNNVLPCDPFTGQSFEVKGGWRAVKNYADSSGTGQQSDTARLASIPSQAVCARWMPNLEGICQCNHDYTLFGIDIRDPEQSSSLLGGNFEIYSPGDENGGSTRDQYVLDGITLQDGWENDFYYYSPEPYQTYTVWSSGKNGRTFPPWISRKKLSSKANQCVALWVEDDIIHMSN